MMKLTSTLQSAEAVESEAGNDASSTPEVVLVEELAAVSARSSLKRARTLFSSLADYYDEKLPTPVVPLRNDRNIYKMSVARRIRTNYPVILASVEEDTTTTTASSKMTTLTSQIIQEMKQERANQLRTGIAINTKVDNTATALTIHREVDIAAALQGSSSTMAALALPGQTVILDIGGRSNVTTGATTTAATNAKSGGVLVQKKPLTTSSSRIPVPKWHAPWRLSTVISSHLGWVRSITFDPTNDMFATGAGDRTIKIFDFAKACVGVEDALKLTLTGHISTVRGLAFSDRHPYLFSAGEDKMIKCWDLETNQVVRHYHGHLSGIFALKLHPTLDLLLTGGRDAVCRVWDVRSKHQVHCLTGHDNTVGSILTKATDPQVITGSYDSTIKLWDLAAGKCMTTLTHHKKSVRALVQPSFENTFFSAAADTCKKWSRRDGRFIKNFSGHNAVINAVAVNDDGVLVTGADNGTMKLWDYHTGYCFQDMQTIAQPGSLEAENGIFCAEFDLTGTRLITGEADKSIKIWKQDLDASELTDPIDMVAWRKKCLAEAKQRY